MERFVKLPIRVLEEYLQDPLRFSIYASILKERRFAAKEFGTKAGLIKIEIGQALVWTKEVCRTYDITAVRLYNILEEFAEKKHISSLKIVKGRNGYFVTSFNDTDNEGTKSKRKMADSTDKTPNDHSASTKVKKTKGNGDYQNILSINSIEKIKLEKNRYKTDAAKPNDSEELQAPYIDRKIDDRMIDCRTYRQLDSDKPAGNIGGINSEKLHAVSDLDLLASKWALLALEAKPARLVNYSEKKLIQHCSKYLNKILEKIPELTTKRLEICMNYLAGKPYVTGMYKTWSDPAYLLRRNAEGVLIIEKLLSFSETQEERLKNSERPNEIRHEQYLAELESNPILKAWDDLDRKKMQEQIAERKNDKDV